MGCCMEIVDKTHIQWKKIHTSIAKIKKKNRGGYLANSIFILFLFISASFSFKWC